MEIELTVDKAGIYVDNHISVGKIFQIRTHKV